MKRPLLRQATPEDADCLVDASRSGYRENRELGVPATAETATVGDLHDWLDADRRYGAQIEQQVIGEVRTDGTSPERHKISRLGIHDD